MSKCPVQTGRPREMQVLEQVICMVWLAENKTLEELRQGQYIIEEQGKQARKAKAPEMTFADLSAMMDNYCAAVAYQTFPEHNTWMAFINVPEV